MFLFFFFQAEDGIRDLYVTGVQTCALPISEVASTLPTIIITATSAMRSSSMVKPSTDSAMKAWAFCGSERSEERRVGKECRSRWSPDHEKKKKKEVAV